MKTFIVSLLLLCAVLTFIIFNTAYIGHLSDEMLSLAEDLPGTKEAFEADISSALEKTQKLWDLWDKTIDKFTFTIGYGHIDRTDYAIIELYSAAKNGDGDSFITAAAKFCDCLTRMKKLESFDFGSFM